MTELALLECVASRPEDDTPRLVLADWWEENGQPERGEFVRVQCELAKRPDRKSTPTGRIMVCDACQAETSPYRVKHHRNCPIAALQRRERELFLSLAQQLRFRGKDFKWAVFLDPPPADAPTAHTTYSRGFVSSITCTAADLLRVERALLWPPEMMKCPACDVSPGMRRYATTGGDWIEDECNVCSGTGRIALPRPTDVCPQIKWRVLEGSVDTETHQRTINDGKKGPCPKWCKCKGVGTMPRPFTATCQPIELVTLTAGYEADGGYVGMYDVSARRAAELFREWWPWVNFCSPDSD